MSPSSQRCQRLTPSLTLKYANAFITIQASFYSPRRACVLLESGPRPHDARPKHPSLPLVPGLLRAMTTQRYFTLGAGPEFCGSVNSGRSSNAVSFRACSPSHPRLSLHFSWYQQTGRWTTSERTGEFLCAANIECTYRFSPPLTAWVPKTLVKK